MAEIEYKIEEAEENSDNKEFMLKAIDDKQTWVLAYASEKLLADKDLIMKAVAEDGQILYYASQDLRDDKDVVLTAVKNKWLIIKYASKRLRSDKEIALAAITKSPKASIYVDEKLLKDPDIDIILNPPEEAEAK